MQSSLFTERAERQTIELEQGKLELITNLFDNTLADELFHQLLESLHWQQDEIRVHGRVIPVPRLQAWYGDPGTEYSYSGIQLSPRPWTPELDTIRAQLTAVFGESFNTVLCNLYRHGQDSVSWHADNEPELGANPLIASVSLGASRRFQLKPKRGKLAAMTLELPHNSVLLMSGALQHHWVHQVPKTRQPVGPRINLTFRQLRRP